MARESEAVDQLDLRILGELKSNARISWRELGERVHLSSTSSADRVRRLEESGVITGYTVATDPARLGRGLRAEIDAVLPPGADPDAFEAKLLERDEIVFAAYVTGAADYTIIADCAGAEGLDGLIRWLKTAGAARTESKVVLRPVIG